MVASKLRENARLRQVRWVRVNASKNARTLSRRLTFAALIYPRGLGQKKKKVLENDRDQPKTLFLHNKFEFFVRSIVRSIVRGTFKLFDRDRSIDRTGGTRREFNSQTTSFRNSLRGLLWPPQDRKSTASQDPAFGIMKPRYVDLAH